MLLSMVPPGAKKKGGGGGDKLDGEKERLEGGEGEKCACIQFPEQERLDARRATFDKFPLRACWQCSKNISGTFFQGAHSAVEKIICTRASSVRSENFITEKLQQKIGVGESKDTFFSLFPLSRSKL